MIPYILLFSVIFLAVIISLGFLYCYCCKIALRGDLDLITDEETGRPMNSAFFRNPFANLFKKIKS